MEKLIRIILLAACLLLMFFVFDFLIPKIKLKYRLHKEMKIRRIREEEFKKMMDRLEIK